MLETQAHSLVRRFWKELGSNNFTAAEVCSLSAGLWSAIAGEFPSVPLPQPLRDLTEHYSSSTKHGFPAERIRRGRVILDSRPNMPLPFQSSYNSPCWNGTRVPRSSASDSHPETGQTLESSSPLRVAPAPVCHSCGGSLPAG